MNRFDFAPSGFMPILTRRIAILAIAATVVSLAAPTNMAQDDREPGSAAVSPPSVRKGEGAARGADVIPRGSSQSPLRKLREANPAVVPSPAASASGKIERYSRQLLKKYDADGNGELRGDEIGALPESLRVSDLDRNGVITADELARRIVAYARRRSIRIVTLNSPTPLGAEARPSSADQSSQAEVAASGRPEATNAVAANEPDPKQPAKRFFVRSERLPTGLAQWFRDSDADGDGQVSLAELHARGATEVITQFADYDRNGDGVITAAEFASRPTLAQATSQDAAGPTDSGDKATQPGGENTVVP
jgi:Ca2+-binding EF-hand superfamily protein